MLSYKEVKWRNTPPPLYPKIAGITPPPHTPISTHPHTPGLPLPPYPHPTPPHPNIPTPPYPGARAQGPPGLGPGTRRPLGPGPGVWGVGILGYGGGFINQSPWLFGYLFGDLALALRIVISTCWQEVTSEAATGKLVMLEAKCSA